MFIDYATKLESIISYYTDNCHLKLWILKYLQ